MKLVRIGRDLEHITISLGDVCCESFIGDGEGPPESACRSRFQTAASCEGKEPWW
jgi:hypothetical protein